VKKPHRPAPKRPHHQKPKPKPHHNKPHHNKPHHNKKPKPYHKPYPRPNHHQKAKPEPRHPAHPKQKLKPAVPHDKAASPYLPGHHAVAPDTDAAPKTKPPTGVPLPYPGNKDKKDADEGPPKKN